MFFSASISVSLISKHLLAAASVFGAHLIGVILKAQALIQSEQLAECSSACSGCAFATLERKSQYLIEGEKQHGSSDFRSGMEG